MIWGVSAGFHTAAALLFISIPGLETKGEGDEIIEKLPPMHIQMTIAGNPVQEQAPNDPVSEKPEQTAEKAPESFQCCNASDTSEQEKNDKEIQKKTEPTPLVTRGTGPSTVLEPADYSQNTPPPYPRLARRLGYEGVVLIDVQVGCSGRCLSAEISKSSGHSVLDKAALEAVKNWKFNPARKAGTPVIGCLRIPIRFSLN